MRFSPWFAHTQPTKPSYRPSIDLLEDRTVPAGLRAFYAPAVPPATHLLVIAPAVVEPGAAFSVKVEALNANNQVATAFTGTVHIALASADAGATLPKSFTISAANHGVYTFQAKLAAIGEQTLEATSGALTGMACLNVEPANVQVYVPSYIFGVAYVYPFGFVPYPVASGVVPFNPTQFVTNIYSGPSATTSQFVSTNPIDNISYGLNPFGTGAIPNSVSAVAVAPSVSRL